MFSWLLPFLPQIAQSLFKYMIHTAYAAKTKNEKQNKWIHNYATTMYKFFLKVCIYLFFSHSSWLDHSQLSRKLWITLKPSYQTSLHLFFFFTFLKVFDLANHSLDMHLALGQIFCPVPIAKNFLTYRYITYSYYPWVNLYRF